MNAPTLNPRRFRIQTVRKSSDESVTNSATVQNDDQLLIALQPNVNYAFQAYIYYTAHEDGDITLAFTVPAGATLVWGTAGFYDAALTVIGSVTITGSGSELDAGGLAGLGFASIITGTVAMGATAGNLQFQFSQATSNANATTVKAGSYLSVWKVVS